MSDKNLYSFLNGPAYKLIYDAGVRREILKLVGSSGGGIVSEATLGDLPTTGTVDVIYITEDDNSTYRWDGSAYVQIGGTSSSFADITGDPTDNTALVDYVAAAASGGSPRIVFLSVAVGAGGADLSLWSQTFGTDHTTAIQAILDDAVNHSALEVVVDDAYGVTGLDVSSNTTIRCLNRSCGFILKNGSNRTLIANKNLVIDNAGIKLDSNINLIGGTWNANGWSSNAGILRNLNYDSTGGIRGVVRMYGVDYFKMTDALLLNPSCYTVHILNSNYGTFSGNEINVGLTVGSHNQDGLHFNGFCSNWIVTNNLLYTMDDKIAMNADDVNNDPSNPVYPYYAGSDGPLLNFFIENNSFNGGIVGLRLLSAGSKIKNVKVDGLYGNTKGHGVIVDVFSGVVTPGNGNVEDVEIANVNLDVDYLAGLGGFTVVVNANTRNLKLRNISGSLDGTQTGLVNVYIKGGTHTGFSLDGLYSDLPNVNTNQYYGVYIAPGAGLLAPVFKNIYTYGYNSSTTGIFEGIHNDGNLYSPTFSCVNGWDINALFSNGGNMTAPAISGVNISSGDYFFQNTGTVIALAVSNFNYNALSNFLSGTFSGGFMGDGFIRSGSVGIGDGVTTTMVITHSLGAVPGSVHITPTTALSSFYVSAKTSTTFTIVFSTAPPLSSSINWSVGP